MRSASVQLDGLLWTLRADYHDPSTRVYHGPLIPSQHAPDRSAGSGWSRRMTGDRLGCSLMLNGPRSDGDEPPGARQRQPLLLINVTDDRGSSREPRTASFCGVDQPAIINNAGELESPMT